MTTGHLYDWFLNPPRPQTTTAEILTAHDAVIATIETLQREYARELAERDRRIAHVEALLREALTRIHGQKP